MSETKQISRRTFVGGLFATVGILATGCGGSGPNRQTSDLAEREQDPLFDLRQTPAYRLATDSRTGDPLFNAAACSLVSFDPSRRVSSIGGVFPSELNGRLRIITVGHVASGAGLFDPGTLKACYVPSSPGELVRVEEVEGVEALDGLEDGRVALDLGRLAMQQFERLIDSGILVPIQLSGSEINGGDHLNFPNIRTGAMDPYKYMGAGRSVSVDVISGVGLDPDSLHSYVQIEAAISDNYDQAINAFTNFVCDGDSGRPLLDEQGRAAQIIASLPISAENQLGQMCGPIVHGV